MEPITIREIVEAVDGKLLGDFQALDETVTHVFTDSRNPIEGGLFIPLVGERFDGHAFIQSALQEGGGGCFTMRERDSYLPGKFYIKVTSTQKALRDLATHYKRKFQIPFVAITGSVGKTTTKDMVAAVLGERFKVLKTEGNYNNEIGLPMTLLRLNQSHQICVLEMGMSSFGEIEYLSQIVEPDVALITNVGDAHIEFLGSRENILKAKCEIFSHMNPEKSLAILNGDDALLQTLQGTLSFTTLFCGTGSEVAYQAIQVETDGECQVNCTVKSPAGAYRVEIPALGRHMLYPTLMAAAVAEHFGMTTEEIIKGVGRFAPTKMRMNIIKGERNITILDDAYNANPQSMRAAVEVLSKAGAGYKVAVLGDMMELGALSETLHTSVGDYIGTAGIDCLVAIGSKAQHMAEAAQAAGVARVEWFAERDQAVEVLAELVRPDCTVLVKASRSMAFETLVARLISLAK